MPTCIQKCASRTEIVELVKLVGTVILHPSTFILRFVFDCRTVMNIRALLGDPSIYNYKSYLAVEATEQERNTIELFAFGEYPHYVKYQPNYIELDNNSLLKLVKLTILSIASKHEGSSVLQDEFRNAIGPALSTFERINEREVLLDELFIGMVDQKLLDAKLEDLSSTVWIEKVHTLRDAYAGEPLRVLSHDDVADKDLGAAVKNLQNWAQRLAT